MEGVMFWQPSHTYRGSHGYWWNRPSMRLVEIQGLAANLFYRHFNVLPGDIPADNDRDNLRW